MNAKVTLQLGKFKAQVQDLQNIIDNYSKDKHLLVESDLKAIDEMNFKAIEKMCSSKVINLLENHSGSKGTQLYLKLMALIRESFLNKSVSNAD